MTSDELMHQEMKELLKGQADIRETLDPPWRSNISPLTISWMTFSRDNEHAHNNMVALVTEKTEVLHKRIDKNVSEVTERNGQAPGETMTTRTAL